MWTELCIAVCSVVTESENKIFTSCVGDLWRWNSVVVGNPNIWWVFNFATLCYSQNLRKLDAREKLVFCSSAGGITSFTCWIDTTGVVTSERWWPKSYCARYYDTPIFPSSSRSHPHHSGRDLYPPYRDAAEWASAAGLLCRIWFSWSKVVLIKESFLLHR